MQGIKYDILKEIYKGLSDEKNELKRVLDKNLTRVAEIEKYLIGLEEKENSEFKVFSPRSVEVVYKEDIEQNKTEKRLLEKENQVYYKKINKLNKHIAGLEAVLGDGIGGEETKYRDSYAAVSENTDLQHNLRVLDIQEKERQRIARDLHDTSLQNLAHLVHKIELSSMFMEQDPLRAKLELAAVNKNLKGIIDDIRNTIFDLRPMTFDDLGLKESFERLFEKWKESNRHIDFVTEIDDLKSNNNLVLMTIFRVVQECCANAIEHSGCSKVCVSVKTGVDNCEIIIQDNGSGFDINEVFGKKEKHFGLLVMKERVQLLGGFLQVSSDADNGTKIQIEIPVENVRG